MKKPIKAVLLSAFVIPGAGHIYLKRYLVAGILILTSLIAFSILVSIAIEKALVITDKILLGEVSADITTISKLITEQGSNTSSSTVNIATSGFIIAWVIGVIDSYRIAKNIANNT